MTYTGTDRSPVGVAYFQVDLMQADPNEQTAERTMNLIIRSQAGGTEDYPFFNTVNANIAGNPSDTAVSHTYRLGNAGRCHVALRAKSFDTFYVAKPSR